MGFEFKRDIMGGDTEGDKGGDERRARKARDDAFAANIKDNPNYAGITFSGDEAIRQGQAVGLSNAATMYGQSAAETGRDVQDIKRRRKDALDGNDPATDALRRGRNAQLRAAKSSGATGAQQAQIGRLAAQDIGQQEFKSQDKALGEYQSLMGNILGGTNQMAMGYAGLEKAGEEVEAPEQGGATVICTELYRQGYMTDDMLERDEAYGRYVRRYDPYVYIGYIKLATPIVSLMKKSKVFTKLISIPAMAWANDMAYDSSMVGRMINIMGNFICRPVGMLTIKCTEINH